MIEISSGSPSYSCGYAFLLTESDVQAHVNEIEVVYRLVHEKWIETVAALWGKVYASESDTFEIELIGLCRHALFCSSPCIYVTAGRLVRACLCFPSANGGPDYDFCHGC